MPQQIRLRFPTAEAAIAYAESKKLAFEVIQPHFGQQQHKSYAANFSYTKVE